MNNTSDKKCIHKYLTICKTNPQPPGFADYLRGTITLYNFSKKYGYKLFIDDSHPLFKFIKKNENLITMDDSSSEIIEILPPLSYDEIFNKLNNIFNSGISFSVMTNSFYNLNNCDLSNWGNITHDCRNYLINTFKPTFDIEKNIEYIFNTIYNLNNEQKFKVIHLRLGDKFIHTNAYDSELYRSYFTKINMLVNSNKDDKYILISDSSIIAKKLKENIKELYYWDNNKIHIGDLLNNINSSLFDTLTDFFIMSKANEIISNGCSGFSTSVSIIYKIKHTFL